VGKDILGSQVDRLRRLFRRTKARPKLRALCRSLKEFAANDEGQPVLSSLLGATSTKILREISTPEALKASVHGLASWILAFCHSGQRYGFPFDVPYLNFHDRILQVHKILSWVRSMPTGASRNEDRWAPSSV